MEIAFWIFTGIVLLFGFVVFFGAPYVPSQRRHFVKAFDELYDLTPKDTLLDLGSGDGAILREAAKRGAQAVGYELNPALVYISRFLSRHDKKIQVVNANLMRKKFPEHTTIIYLFANSRDINKIIRKIETEATKLNRTLYVMSYAFTVKNLRVVKKNDLHTLYAVEPLQMKKA